MIKFPLKRTLQTIHDIKENVDKQLMVLPTEDSDCSTTSRKDVEKCVKSQGQYFEVDRCAIASSLLLQY